MSDITEKTIENSDSSQINTKVENKAIDEKWTQEDWLKIEKNLSPAQLKVINELTKLVSNKKTDNITVQEYIYPVFGEHIYLSIRDLLLKNNLVDKLESKACLDNDNKSEKNNKDKKQKNKLKHGEKSNKLSTADKIKLENTSKTAQTETMKILSSFNSKEMNYYAGLQNNKIIELKGVTFMYIAQFILSKIDMYNKRHYLPNVYEAIVGIQRFLDSVKNYTGRSLMNTMEIVSETMINDLTLWLSKLIKTFNYKGKDLCKINAKLLVESEYDNYIPLIEVKPYKNQVELINTINQGLQTNNGFMISYKAMTNSGKTTMSVAIATMIKLMNESHNNKKTRKQLIYCCNSRSVQDDVCTLFYNAKIKFAYGFVHGNGIKIVNHNTCKNDDERVVIVCSPYVGAQLLKDDYEKNIKNNCESSYWLFLDEPTSDADEANNKFLIDNISVLRFLPKYSILSSATMPNLEKINEIISFHKEKYPNILIKTVYSNEIFIGCEIKTTNMELIMPHLGAKTSAELKTKIENINTVPFLGRLYTHKVVLKLYEDLKDKVHNLPDIDKIFSDVKNLKMDNIRLIALDMLSKLSECPDHIVSQLCSTLVLDSESLDNNINNNKDEDEFTFEDEQKVKEDNFTNTKLEYELLGTYHAYKYQGNNVIFTTDPVKQVRKYFAPLLEILAKERVDSSKKLFDKYNKQINDHKKSVERIMSRTKNQNKMSQEVQDLNENSAPSIDFPLWAQINTLEHIKKFAKSHISEINPKMIRVPYRLENIPSNSVTSDDLLLLLMCGIGIYTQDFKQIDKIYLNHVMQMASNGQLAYIFADSSLSYGANYPVNRIFITDDFANKHSIDTIFQSLSRAGRVGKSYMAEGYIPNIVAETILKYSKCTGSGYGDIESKNMINTFKNILDKEKLNLDKNSSEVNNNLYSYNSNNHLEINIVPISIVINDTKNMKNISSNFNKIKIDKPLFTSGSKTRADTGVSWRNYDADKINNKSTSSITTQQIQKQNTTETRYVPPHLRNRSKVVEVQDNNGWTHIQSGK